MTPFGELLASGHRQTLDFFVCGLRDVSEPSVDVRELYYNASVLAHFAQTSTATADGFPTLADLSAFFDQFVMPSAWRDDSALLESAGAQCLILSGFFGDQAARRHNVRWYGELGAGFFARAAHHEGSAPKAQLLLALAEHFELWRQCQSRLSRELRDQRLLLHLPKAS